MDQSADIAVVQDQLRKALVQATRAITQLCAEDLDFYKTIDPNFVQLLDHHIARLVKLIKGFIRFSAPRATYSFNLDAIEAGGNSWRAFVENSDELLDRANLCVDEYKGLVTGSAPRNDEPATQALRSNRTIRASEQSRLSKPQYSFDVQSSNGSDTMFKPILTSKPNAIVPLSDSIHLSSPTDRPAHFVHPYGAEIATYSYPSFVNQIVTPILYHPFESTDATFVDTLEGVDEMLAHLTTASVIAVDIEHHNTHSYLGFVCLLQISTRERDWVVDTLKPWRRKLELLNEVFTDPGIVKVFHGAHMDILWLQQDFGIYVVGLFDTHHASRTLGYTAGSLAYLLKRFANFDAQKQYQTADWRIRPVPEAMLRYAQSDTHFLLYVFDCMRNELLQLSTPSDNKISAVLEKSRDTALQRYELPDYDEQYGLGVNGWFHLLQRSSLTFTKPQFYAFRGLHKWRDGVARLEDESPHQILSRDALLSISWNLPTDKAALFKLRLPLSSYVLGRVQEVVDIVGNSQAQTTDLPDTEDAIAESSKHAARIRHSQPPRVNQSLLASVPSVERALDSELWGTSIRTDSVVPKSRSLLLDSLAVTPVA